MNQPARSSTAGHSILINMLTLSVLLGLCGCAGYEEPSERCPVTSAVLRIRWPGFPSGIADQITVTGDRAYVALAGSGLWVFDVADPSMLSALGLYETKANIRDVAVAGDFAYVAWQETDEETQAVVGGLDVVDVSDPTVPRRAGHFRTGRGAHRVRLAGPHAIIVELDGLVILDVTDPRQPKWIGSYPVVALRDLDLAHHFAFLVTDTDFVVLDVANPAQPFEVGRVAEPARCMQIVGRLAYLGGGDHILRVMEIIEPSRPRLAATVPTRDAVLTIATQENRLLLSVGATTLETMDLSNPKNPKSIGCWRLTSSIKDVAIGNGYAFVAAGLGGVQVVDLADFAPCTDQDNANALASSEAAGLVFSYPTDHSTSRSLGLGGDYAFLGVGAELRIVDIAIPTRPRYMGSQRMLGGVLDIAVNDAFLYGACGSAGLQVLEVSDPCSPRSVGAAADLGQAKVLQLANDRYLLASVSDGFVIYDLKDPSAPARISSLSGLGMVNDLAVVGAYACIAAGRSGLAVVDIGIPTAPSQKASWTIPAINAIGVEAVGDSACVLLEARSLRLIDLSDAAHPILAENRTWANPQGEQYAGVRVWGSFAYAWTTGDGLQLIDLRIPPTKTVLTGFIDHAQIADVQFRGGHAYMASRDGGLHIFDVSDLGRSDTAAVADTPGVARALDVEGSLVFVADGPGGLQIFDVGAAFQLVHLGHHTMPGDVWGIDVVGSIAYLADATNGLVVVDVSQPEQPRPLAVHRTEGAAKAVQVSGHQAYVACSLAGLVIVDVADPARPRRLGACPTPSARGLQVVGDHVCLADAKGGLWIIDITNPARPVTVGRYFELVGEENWGVRDVDWTGDFALLAVPMYGFHILNLKDPTRPEPLFSVSGKFYGIDVFGHHACVSTGDGLELWDCQRPAQPHRVISFDLAAAPWDVKVQGNYAFLAMGTGGLLVLDLTPRPCFVCPPILRSGTISLDWTGSEGTGLEWTSCLSATSWREVPGSRGRVHAELPFESGQRFYRLVSQRELVGGSAGNVGLGNLSIESSHER